MVSLRVCAVFLALVCVTTTVHGAVSHVNRQGVKYKIDKVTDGILSEVLQSIRHEAHNVKELDLSGNVLKKINEADFQPFRNLELLNLSSNVFYEPVDLRSLSKLQTVDLNNNFLQEVLVASSIVTLHAANNNISQVICEGKAPSPKSKRIYLANNKIGSLLDFSNECRRNVEYLDLSLNEIDMVDFSELSDSAHSLKELYLRLNFIFDIKNRQNVAFQQITKIDLSSNKLAFMGAEFGAVKTATSINLSNNKLVLIEENLTFSTSITSFDLRGNGLQCDTLKKMFNKNKQLKGVAGATVLAATNQKLEQCSQNITRYTGPFCCEDLMAPFADRLIALKRKQHSLISGQPSEQEREECEREIRERQMAAEAIRNQYKTIIDNETRKNREKIQLTEQKNKLEEELPIVQNSYESFQRIVVETARELQISVTENPDVLALMRSIIQRFEYLYIEEQNKQSDAIRDWEMYHQKEIHQKEENERLKKLIVDVDVALNNANVTMQGLIQQEQTLAEKLKKSPN